MKKLLLTITAIFALGATAAIADNFDNTSLETVVNTAGLQFSLSGDTSNGFDEVAVGKTFLEHNIGAFTGNVYTELSYGIVSEDVGIDLEYRLSAAYNDFGFYGAASAEYLASSNNLGDGNWQFAPYVGASYDFTDRVGAYGEVGYSWDMSNNWNRNSGYTEVGLNVTVTDNVSIIPSVTRTFDTANDEYQAGLTVGLSF